VRVMGALLDILRHNEAQAFICNAEIVRAAPDSPEKTDAATRQIHWAMYRAALGQITREERNRILSILGPCCPELFAYVPPLPSPVSQDGCG